MGKFCLTKIQSDKVLSDNCVALHHRGQIHKVRAHRTRAVHCRGYLSDPVRIKSSLFSFKTKTINNRSSNPGTYKLLTVTYLSKGGGFLTLGTWLEEVFTKWQKIRNNISGPQKFGPKPQIFIKRSKNFDPLFGVF